MANKKTDISKLKASAPITGFGQPALISGPSWVGLPGLGTGYAHLVNADAWVQFVVDANSLVWMYMKEIHLVQEDILNNNYPMMMRVCRSNFNWTLHGNTDTPWAFQCYKDFVVDNTGSETPGTVRRHWQYDEDRGGSWVTSTGGIVDYPWVAVGFLNDLDIRADGVHIWFGGRAFYDVEDDPINPTPYEFVFNWGYFPVAYYVGAIQDNGYYSCDDPGRGSFVVDNGWRDVLNLYGAPSSYDTGHINNNGYTKILRG